MQGKIHFYSSDTIARRMINVYLAIISILLSYGLDYLTTYFQFKIPWWFDAPAVFGFYGILFWLFENYLWKNKWVRFLANIKTPNWSGNYEGILKGSFNNFESEIPIKIKITQSWQKMLITSKTDNSKSNSITSSFAIAQNDTISLIYEYVNIPFADAVETMNIHRGISTIFLEDDKLKGEYFTGRGRNTFGKYELKKEHGG